MERRRIRCGNAYHFQGDERHVMFVSLVVAAGEGRRVGALTKEPDRQRINVAASRAQDQMWCVRSITADELHPDDVRGRFIRYCQNPARVDDAAGDVDDRFDSDFERDVYRHLIGRGYRVKVQHRVGRFRIDLVVQGQRGRLAVELDGDAYHGPDQWEADRNRQAILERLGWTFHRIRGSAYYRHRDAALAGLWERLEALGIRPAGEPDPALPAEAEDPEPAYVPRHDTGYQAAPPAAEPVSFTATADESLEQAEEAAGTAPGPLREGFPGSQRDFASEARPADPRIPALAQHRAWSSHPVPDVHAANQWSIIEGILDIVTGEGPVVTDRVYELYVRASGGRRVTKPVRDTMDEATDTALKKGLLEQIRDNVAGRTVRTVYLPGASPVMQRRRGDRELEHIPPTEVAAVAGHILTRDPRISDTELMRALLTAFERVRLTSNAAAFLDDCIAIARR